MVVDLFQSEYLLFSVLHDLNCCTQESGRAYCNANLIKEGMNSILELSCKFCFAMNVDQTQKDRFTKCLLAFSDDFDEKEFELNSTDVEHQINNRSIRERDKH